VFFGLLVMFEVLSHLSDEHPTRAKRFERIGLWCFGVAVLAEILAYPYGQRNDALSSSQDTEQRAKIAALENSTQALKTEAENARAQAEGFKAQIADSDARAKSAEAQVASAKAASDTASAKAESFRLDITKATESASQAEARAAEANLALERFKAPRTIDQEHFDRLVSKLSQFSGQTFKIITFADDMECINFKDRLGNIFLKAKWSPPQPPRYEWLAVAVMGVVLGVGKDASEQTREIAKLSASILSSEGIPAILFELSDSAATGWNPAMIQIMVGKKPQ
jgi:hypothetical protein